MDKKDIIKKFYERGVLPSPEDLSGEAPNRTLTPGKKSPADPDKEGVSVNLRKHESAKKLSAQDFIDYYNSKYEKIKNMLLKKMDVVSITNAKTGPSPCGIIGIVKNMTQAGFIFEDTTGELEIIRSGIRELEKINIDDVFGLKGFVRENRFFPKEVVWPDIPLNHRIGRIKGMNIILSNRKSPELVISESRTKNAIQIRNNPEWIDITKGRDKVTILAFKSDNITKDDALFCLRKRSLPEPNPIKTTKKPYLIEEIPDILWLIQDDEWLETHKGITIISCGSKSLAKLDMETRAVEFEKIQIPKPIPSAP